MMGDFLWRRKKEGKKRIFIYDSIDLAFLRSRFGMRLLVEYTVWFFTVCTVTLVYQTSHSTGKRGYRLSRVRIRNLSVPLHFCSNHTGCSINGVFPTRNRFSVSKWYDVTAFFPPSFLSFFFFEFRMIRSWAVTRILELSWIVDLCSFSNSFISRILIDISLILSCIILIWKKLNRVIQSKRRWLRSISRIARKIRR